MGREAETEEAEYVFDFLYVDHKRIGLFMSQFSRYGHLTELVHRRGVTSSSKLEGGIPSVAKAAAGGGESEGVDRTYDTQWSEVLNFLDNVRSRGMLREDVEGAPLGSLVLGSGVLDIVNMQAYGQTFGVMSAAFNEGNSPGATKSGNRHQRRAGKAKDPDVFEGSSSFGFRMLAALSHPIFALLHMGEHRLWAMLNPEFLVGGAADLNMKHGLRVSGDWHVLGILDCEPGPGTVSLHEVGRVCGRGDNHFSEAALQMTNAFRDILGRPADCWGITPLMIMRAVG